MTKFSGNNQEQIITLNDWALLSDQSKENFLKLSSGYDALQSALDIQNNNVTKLDNEIDRLDKELDTAQEENKRYKDALEEIANGHRPADDIASGALHPDNYDALIPDEYKNGQLFIAGIPVYVCYSTPDNTVLLGYATKEDAVKMARVLSNLIQSALNGGKNG